jgi:hypothetical protein
METYTVPLDLMARKYRVLNVETCKPRGTRMSYTKVINKIKENYVPHGPPFSKRPCPENQQEILPFRFLSEQNGVWYVPPYTINKLDNMIRFYPHRQHMKLDKWAVPYEFFHQDVNDAAIKKRLYNGGNRTRRRR